jgi:hypothetical protein
MLFRSVEYFDIEAVGPTLIHDAQCILCNQLGGNIFIVAFWRDEQQRALRALGRRDLLGQVVYLGRPSPNLIVEDLLVVFRHVFLSFVVSQLRQLQRQA